MTIPPSLDFYSAQVLRDHVQHTLAFYVDRAIDPSGGCYHYFLNDGKVYDTHSRHLVSSTRFVFVWAMAARHFSDPRYLAHARHAVNFLRSAHFNADSGGYAWELQWRDGRAQVTDQTHHCYGLAFVLLAYAHAVMAGIEEARPWLYEVFATLEHRFWQNEHHLYADEADAHWRLSPYRGQNANMHMTEACLAAYEATADAQFLDRAETVAKAVIQGLARQGEGELKGLLWEHYHDDWTIDWAYNKGDSRNIFRPWGYQPGHFTEWAKLLVLLAQHRPQEWLLPSAEFLFQTALTRAWDEQHGGLYYGFAPDGAICFPEKYHWVQCETLASAAVLGAHTNNPQYWIWYERLWQYCWTHWVDHQHGAWFRLLSRDNRHVTEEKSPAGKVDYHTTGACYEMMRALAARRQT